MEDKIISQLMNLGLTLQEAKVYLKLLELREAQTGKLCQETNIASSNIYQVLNSLMEKGLVSFRIQNNIKVFMPSNPTALNELFLKMKEKLENDRRETVELISNLKVKQLTEQPESNYKYYEGLSNVKSMWYEINSLLLTLDKQTVPKIYTGKKMAYEPFTTFYDEYHKLRVKKGIHQKMIFPINENKISKKREKQLAEIKYLDLQNEAEWGIIGDLFFMQYITTKTPRAFLIKDKNFCETFRQVFDQIWTTAKNQ